MKKIIHFIVCGVLLMLLEESCKKKEIETVPTVAITGISDSLLNIGDTLVIKGSGFAAAAAGNLVSVASVSYTVIQASPGQLSVVVPKAAQSGTLSVGLPGGKATQFGQAITIIGPTQPVIASISPATAYEGDTIVVTGKNFAIPYTSNSITFNGSTSGVIVNATPTELRVVLPDLTFSGPVQVTTNGQSSPPYAYTIAKVDPNIDGHVNWLSLFYPGMSSGRPYGSVTLSSFNTGATNAALPQGKSLFSVSGPLCPSDPNAYDQFSPNFPGFLIPSFVVSDGQHNAYYLTASTFPFPADYHLMKMPADDPSHPVSIWTKTFDAPGQYNDVSEPTYGTTVQAPYVPLEQIGIDGNNLYIKLGASDDYYVGDVLQPSPVFNLQHNVLGDSTAYNLQFGQDYVFYLAANAIPGWNSDPPPSDTLRYTKKGSKVSHNIPVDGALGYGSGFVSIMADPSHGNDLLIVNRQYDGENSPIIIRKFNPDTQEMKVLYDASNWVDAVVGYQFVGNSGFLWLGHHIYYACASHSISATAMHRVDDDGSSVRPATVYGRMEALTTNQAQRFILFSGK